jgi:hypothetical protein
MKKYFYLISCFLIVLSCQKNNQSKNVPINLGMVKINIPEFVDSLRGYYKQNLADEKSGVITIDFRIRNDTSIFYVSSIIDKGSIKDSAPGYYSMVDKFPVLVYTGIEKNLTFDSLYLANLYKVTDSFLEEYLEDEDGSIIQVPPNYNPVTWRIETVSQRIVKTEVLNNRKGGLAMDCGIDS